jgi:hypothetical protein
MVAAFVYSSAGPVPLPDQPGDDRRSLVLDWPSRRAAGDDPGVSPDQISDAESRPGRTGGWRHWRWSRSSSWPRCSPCATSASRSDHRHRQYRQSRRSRLCRPACRTAVNPGPDDGTGSLLGSQRALPGADRRPDGARRRRQLSPGFHAPERDHKAGTTRTVTTLIRRGPEASGPAMAPPSHRPLRPAAPRRPPAAVPRSAARWAGRPG